MIKPADAQTPPAPWRLGFVSLDNTDRDSGSDLKIILTLFNLFSFAYLLICYLLIMIKQTETSICFLILFSGIIYIFYGIIIPMNSAKNENDDEQK